MRLYSKLRLHHSLLLVVLAVTKPFALYSQDSNAWVFLADPLRISFESITDEEKGLLEPTSTVLRIPESGLGVTQRITFDGTLSTNQNIYLLISTNTYDPLSGSSGNYGAIPGIDYTITAGSSVNVFPLENCDGAPGNLCTGLSLQYPDGIVPVFGKVYYQLQARQNIVGSTGIEITIRPTNDSEYEIDESFSIQLIGSNGIIPKSPDALFGLIEDDDKPFAGVWLTSFAFDRKVEDDTIGEISTLPAQVDYTAALEVRENGSGFTGRIATLRSSDPTTPIIEATRNQIGQIFGTSASATIPSDAEINIEFVNNLLQATISGIEYDVDRPDQNPAGFFAERSIIINAALDPDSNGIIYTDENARETTRYYLSREAKLAGKPPIAEAVLEGSVTLSYSRTPDSLDILNDTQIALSKVKQQKLISEGTEKFLVEQAGQFEKRPDLSEAALEANTLVFLTSNYSNTIRQGSSASGGVVLGGVAARGSQLGAPTVSPFSQFAKFTEDGKILNNQGALFLAASTSTNPDELNVFTKGNGTLTGLFDEKLLQQAERNFVRAIYYNPFYEPAIIGLFEARSSRAIYYNLLADRTLLKVYNKRLESSVATGEPILRVEINLLGDALANARQASAIMLNLWFDQQREGVGQLLRGNRTIEASPALEEKRVEVQEIAIQSVRRVGEISLERSERNLLLAFNSEAGREAVLGSLVDLQIYLENAIRLFSSFSGDVEDLEKASFLFSDTGLGSLVGLKAKAAQLEQQVRQGLNPFGFNPDFVPFFVVSDQDSFSDNVTTAASIARQFVTESRSYDQAARENLNAYVNSRVEYETQLNQLEISYQERLRALVGTIDNGPTIPLEQRYEPDLLTYGAVLLDSLEIQLVGENNNEVQFTIDAGINPEYTSDCFVAENLEDQLFEQRQQVLDFVNAQSPLGSNGIQLKLTSIGQIGIQQLNIANAYVRKCQALNEFENLQRRLEIIQETADEVAGEQRNIAYLILENGERVAALQRQSGEYQAEAAIAQAQAEAKAAKKKGKWGAISGVVSLAVGSSVGQIFNKPTEEESKIGVNYALAIGNTIGGIVSSISAGASDAKLALTTGNIRADLARKIADIDAQVTEINSLQNAEIQFSSARTTLIQAESEIKQLMLQQANLRLAMRYAERDALREELVLQQMLSEVEGLIADWARQRRLLEDNVREPWFRPDYRAAFNAYQVDADYAFLRAQSWTYMTIRAFEYYVNESQDVADLYNLLYRARKAEHLDTLLLQIESRLNVGNIISPNGCPERSVLSLRYHILSQTPVELDSSTQNLVQMNKGLSSDDSFLYFDRVTGATLIGSAARAAKMRDFLDESLKFRGTDGTLYDTRTPNDGRVPVLLFEFATDLFLREGDGIIDNSNLGIENPIFNNTALRSQTIAGFTPQNCATGSSRHGVSINLVGNRISAGNSVFGNMTLELSQLGTMYQRSGAPDQFYNPADPLQGLIAYPTYRQLLPNQFRLTGAETELQTTELPGTRKAQLTPRINGQPASDQRLSLLFTDRAVANDRWRITVDWDQHISSRRFLLELEEELNTALNTPNKEFNYIEDIEIRLGWVAKFTQ